MNKVVDYKVISCDDVPSAIKEGWQPWGSAYVATGGGWHQPMVKHEVECKCGLCG